MQLATVGGKRSVARACTKLLLEFDHVQRLLFLAYALVITPHDLPHLSPRRLPPANLHDLAAADVAEEAILLDAQNEIGGNVVLLVPHEPGVADGVDAPSGLPIAADLQ